ncbi:hypothetical protein [Xenophilus azovorans]|uniref:hypothetical protein n=1 Tax=Xenophilus azovorans TaxID=151755 RepID=UPI001B8049CC|nr:hypothetical protein [Xenophilus azovorans]
MNSRRALAGHMPAHVKSALALAIAVLGLAGCGGGGGGGGVAFPGIAAAPVPAPAPAPASSPAPTPTPSPEPSPEPEPEPASDPSTCIAAPQAGSTAEVGNATEGIWYQAGVVNGFAAKLGLSFVEPSDSAMGLYVEEQDNPASIGVYSGQMAFDANAGTWQFSSGVIRAPGTGASQALTGGGAYVGRSSITGTYAAGGGAQQTFIPWTYDLESNSLAMTPEFLARHWGGYGLGDFVIAADGSASGSTMSGHPYGACSFTGTVRLAEPSTKKNRLEVALTFTNAAQLGQQACILNGALTGRGFVHVNQNLNNGTCTRSNYIDIFLRAPDGRFSSSLFFVML